MALTVPELLASSCRRSPKRAAWLERLPDTIRDLERRWSLTVEAPFDGKEATASWVAPAVLADGTSAVLKVGMPHMEAEQEISGLRFWDGDPTVRLIEANDDLGAMLLERAEPGTLLRESPEPEQDTVIAGLLRRLWRLPPEPHPFRPLSDLMGHWSREAQANAERWSDAGIVREGLRLFTELPRTAPEEVLLATDLHAGNVVRAQRQPWLVIDPKPFIGGVAYDATQHLLNCEARLFAEPDRTIRHFADLLGVDHERVRLWMFARVAAAPWAGWKDDDSARFARAIAP
jgi:streptomycin 6-kinase